MAPLGVRTQEFSRSYNNSSGGVNFKLLTVELFGGSYFNSKKEFKELFFMNKNHPRFIVSIKEFK